MATSFRPGGYRSTDGSKAHADRTQEQDLAPASQHTLSTTSSARHFCGCVSTR
ncbi:hypothetical protein EST38_g3105 [Candolleomyces aberdarensis]|uniref:Uncharacterized protein n=1 Tax=Candolleomyces aberdarensis TaxID=2316362 RepID=A0A4Q2DTW5_9AGAR|nr:hypothetical protein EST38_g3105 [Candolleomyces aberdarensis]